MVTLKISSGWCSMIPTRLRAKALQLLEKDHSTYTCSDIASIVDPRTVSTPALDLIDQELERLIHTPDGRLIISMPPQEGKSTRVSRDFPIQTLIDNPDCRIVTASYSQSLANRNGRVIRNAINAHPSLGLAVARDQSAAKEWTLAGKSHGGVVSVGRGAGISGRPADLLIIDDPLKDRVEADSDTVRESCWEWWTDTLSARLAPGAPVVLIMTRWHEDDLAGRLQKKDVEAGWRVLNIPAQCEDSLTDPLHRQVGEYMISARGRTHKQWDARRMTVGPRAWASLYQGRPSPAEGGILKRHWWKRYEQPRWVIDDKGRHWVPTGTLIQSWDLAFKGKVNSDYVVGQVWQLEGMNAYLLDQVRGRWDFVESCNQITGLSRKWPQATAKLVEDKANGPAVISALKSSIPGLIAVEPNGDKIARASAISPLATAGNLWLPSTELARWVEDFIEECAIFPSGKNDDQVDAASQGVARLFLPVMGVGGTFYNYG